MTRVVESDNAAYRYADNRQGLAPTSLRVDPGQQVLITGPSGCGKSTLARCLTGLIPHLYRGTLEGAIWLDGLCTLNTPLWQLAERAGMVFQNPAAQMLAHSVEEEIVFGLENLGLPQATIRERLEAALSSFGLSELRTRSPHTLSGGEQQKLALAAMTARQTPLLVLDEPLSMLDTTACTELVAYLQQQARSGIGIVVCEHRAEYLGGVPGLRTIHLGALGATSASSINLRSRRQELPPFWLEVSGLTVRLGHHVVLNNMSFSVPSGQVAAVVGRNGVGKTTLLRAIAGLQGHGGTVMVGGDRPDVGLVFQNPDVQLFNPTVREEILYRVSDPDMTLYDSIVDALGLKRYEDAPPLLLSEGEKKRVALATVLMRQPRHGILLDEPALGQDTAHKAMLVCLARALAAAGQLVIITTHDVALAIQTDRLLLLGPEGFVADGPPSALLADERPWLQLGLVVPSWLRVPAAAAAPQRGAGSSRPSGGCLIGGDGVPATEGGHANPAAVRQVQSAEGWAPPIAEESSVPATAHDGSAP